MEKSVATEDLYFGYTSKEILDVVISNGTNLIIALAILVIGMWIAKFAVKKINKVLSKRKMDESLKGFLCSLTSIGIKALVVITAMGQLGIEMTSFVAILGAAGLAIGMAFSGTLSNFAGGVMLLVFKPYKVGDYINAQGEEGSVQEIQIFNTIILTVDNKTVIVPNGPMSNGNITNYTKQEFRRVDTVVGIGYGENLKLAKDTIKKVAENCDLIDKSKEIFIGVTDLGDSSVNLTVRVWTKTSDYWTVFFYMNDNVYAEIENTNGLSIPYPHQVEIKQVETVSAN